MNSKNKLFVSLLLSSIVLLAFSFLSLAETTDMNTNGILQVKPSEQTDPLDPENPLEPVDPGEGPSTIGDLRIDFVSAINFADTEITKTNRKYPSLAQLFHTEIPARASYIQITDLRQESPGWNLQLKQKNQFKNENQIELNGATLSFDKGWANSGGIGKPPTMFRDSILIDDIGSSYQIASATKGAGKGTWLLSFGASSDNHSGQENTLSPLKKEDGLPMMDELFNKEMYTNSAINLSVPDKTTIVPGHYQTELIWILQATP